MKTSSVYVNERENIAEAMNLNENKLSTICDKNAEIDDGTNERTMGTDSYL